MTENDVLVTCPTCISCGKRAVLRLDADAYNDWVEKRLLVQEAFPDISKEDRELLLTGTHPECWRRIFDGN